MKRMIYNWSFIIIKLPLFHFSSLTLPQTIGQVSVEKLADYILVKTTFGFSLAWDGISGIYLKISEELKGKSCGLCGNYNGIQSDDFIIQQGKGSRRNVLILLTSFPFTSQAVCTQKGTTCPRLGKISSYNLTVLEVLSEVWMEKYIFMSCLKTISYFIFAKLRYRTYSCNKY